MIKKYALSIAMYVTSILMLGFLIGIIVFLYNTVM